MDVGGLDPAVVATPDHLGWSNIEDVVYHDRFFDDPRFDDHPDIRSLVHREWTFNRAMEWHEEGLDGCILCSSASGELCLTGTSRASEWLTSETNTVTHLGDTTTFSKQSRLTRDTLVLPAFQFHRRQHPCAELDVNGVDGEWQLSIGIKGRAGAPLLTTGWQGEPGLHSLSISDALERRGYTTDFAELHFVMSLRSAAVDSASVTFSLQLPAAPAVIGCLPVIRTKATVDTTGMPVAAAVFDAHGTRLGTNEVTVVARIGEESVELQESGGLWTGHLIGLPVGEHDIQITAHGVVEAEGHVRTRVTDGRFLAYDPPSGLFTRDGEPVGPLSGSYQGTFHFRDIDSPAERLVQGKTIGTRGIGNSLPVSVSTSGRR